MRASRPDRLRPLRRHGRSTVCRFGGGPDRAGPRPAARRSSWALGPCRSRPLRLHAASAVRARWLPSFEPPSRVPLGPGQETTGSVAPASAWRKLSGTGRIDAWYRAPAGIASALPGIPFGFGRRWLHRVPRGAAQALWGRRGGGVCAASGLALAPPSGDAIGSSRQRLVPRAPCLPSGGLRGWSVSCFGGSPASGCADVPWPSGDGARRPPDPRVRRGQRALQAASSGAAAERAPGTSGPADAAERQRRCIDATGSPVPVAEGHRRRRSPARPGHDWGRSVGVGPRLTSEGSPKLVGGGPARRFTSCGAGSARKDPEAGTRHGGSGEPMSRYRPPRRLRGAGRCHERRVRRR